MVYSFRERPKTFLQGWQEKSAREIVTHTLSGAVLGMAPHAQALLLARYYLRGDLDDYPPFCGKPRCRICCCDYL